MQTSAQPYLWAITLHPVTRQQVLFSHFQWAPPPKEATVSEWLLVGTTRQGQRSRGCHVDSEVRVNPGLPSRMLQFIQPQTNGDLGASGHMWGSVSCWPSRALTVASTGRGQALRRQWPSPRLCHLLAAPSALDTICKTCSHTPHMAGLRSRRASCVWRLAPSAMTAEQGLRTQRWGRCQLSSHSARTGPWRVSRASGPALSCQNRN